jgi:hypothetical protein
MAHRDYEEQPEHSDLGASVQLESSQHLGAPPGDRDGLDAGYVAADRPYGLDEDGVTGAGMRDGGAASAEEAAVHIVEDPDADTATADPDLRP